MNQPPADKLAENNATAAVVAPPIAAPLTPLPYHQALRDCLRREEPEIWRWYASQRVREEHAEAVRFELLKSTYRLDRATQPVAYAAAESAAARLGLTVPLTLYQAQNPAGLQAALAFVPDEAHIVLHGPVAAKLAEPELRALLAHELSHLVLWRCDDGAHLIVEQILAAFTSNPRAKPPHLATARLLRLYGEVFCDRGALAAVADPLIVIAMLWKVHAERDAVSPAAFLQQADEIFQRGARGQAADTTPPEALLRARAVKLFADGDPDAESQIRDMLERPLTLDSLDLLGQQRVAALTRRVIDALLTPPWFQTEATLAHARLFFHDYFPPLPPPADDSLAADLRTDDPGLADYYCYVLLDFVTADRDLEDRPLAAALILAERFGWRDRFAEFVQRELRLRKRQFEKIDRAKERLLETP